MACQTLQYSMFAEVIKADFIVDMANRESQTQIHVLG